MKHDYLWDKTGRDPDIERLEDLLSPFRYSDEAQAASNVLGFTPKATRNIKPWIFALAACVALGTVALTAWNFSLGDEAKPEQIAASTREREDPASMVSDPGVKTGEAGTAFATPPAAVTVRKRRLALSKDRKTAVSRKRPGRLNTPVLTAEERYAYSQLVLALSVTSSKWQMVQDSINGSNHSDTTDK